MKLHRAYGQDLDSKLQSAVRMIHELDAKTPGRKHILKTKAISDNAMVASMLIQAAERYWARRK